MAIPRLTEGAEATFLSPGRFHRRHVSRACESCRQRKTKCTGDKSGCRNCREAGIICCYTDGKREKSKRQLASLEAKLEQYENAFTGLSRRYNVSPEQLMSIGTSLDTTGDQTSQHSNLLAAHGPSAFLLPRNPFTPNQLFRIPVHTTEDFNKDDTSRATGFIGESSEISWLQKLDSELSHSGDSGNQNTGIIPHQVANPAGCVMSKLSYHLDDLDLPSTDKSSLQDLPSYAPAKRLYQIYMDSVHPSFPIIGTSTFGSQLQTLFSNSSLQPGSKWLAILNLIFAVSTKYCYTASIPGENDRDAHKSYFARARALSLDERGFHHYDLQQIQVEGLTAFYLLASGQINRAWRLCGDAVRGAMSLGLHLRTVGACTSDTSKEIRYRVWWSLYTLEHRLSVMTGRPSHIPDGVCTTPMPVPFDEHDFPHEEVMSLIRRSSGPSTHLGRTSGSLIDPNIKSRDTSLTPSKIGCHPASGSLYFIQLVELILIAKRMTSKLYSAEGVQEPPPSKEFTIRGLMIEIDSWCMKLPKEYDFTSTSTSTKTPLTLAGQRMSLALLFYSTKIGITRPCLDIPKSPPENDNVIRANDFYQKTAVECIEAACHVLRLFPNPPDTAALYKITPWWCVLHFLMQATAIIYLELSYNTRHVPEKASMVTKAAIKSFEWLSAMSRTSETSEKARTLCERILNRLGIQHNVEVPRTPQEEDDSSQPPPFSDETPDDEERLSEKMLTSPSSPLPQSDNSIVHSSSLELGASGVLDIMQDEKPVGPHNPFEEDDYLPYDPSTGQLTGSFFPTGPNNDLGLGYYWNDQI